MAVSRRFLVETELFRSVSSQFRNRSIRSGDSFLMVSFSTGTASSFSQKSRSSLKVFEKSSYISYGACGLPYFVGGMIDKLDDLVSLTVEQMINQRGVPTHIRHEVTEIDRAKKTVRVKKLDTGAESIHMYDKLVIATGARPIRPDIKGADAEGVYYLRTVEDGICLKHAVQQNEKKTAVIVGGGFIGLEVAEEMVLSGLKVHVYEKMPRLLPFLPESFSEAVVDTLSANGVTVHLGKGVSEIMTEEGHVSGVCASDGEVLSADIVLMSIGVIPNAEIAKNAGLETGIKGSIAVGDDMQTSDLSIWACGDCVQMKNRITGKPVYIPLGTTANKQGRIAGGNAVGGKETFSGVLGSMVTKIFDLYIAATGLSESQAKERGYEAVNSVITKRDRASYYPGGRDNRICLILDQKTGRLLGASGIGSESVAGRINVFAAAITCGMTVSEINELDLVYAPPVAPVYDPILIAASQAMKKVQKITENT